MSDYTFLPDQSSRAVFEEAHEFETSSAARLTSGNERKQTMDEAAIFVLAVLCSEKEKKRKKTRQWTRSWIARRGQYGLSILQRELEVKYIFFI